jgi:hypothetical protein
MTTVLLRELRADLDDAFSADTAASAAQWNGGSVGHCAVVAMVVDDVVHARFASALVREQSHWFNKVETDDGWFYADLTADQFGMEPVIVAADSPHDGTRARDSADISRETWARYHRLRSRLPARWRDA